MLVLLISFSSLSIMYTIIMLNTAIVMLQETEEKQTELTTYNGDKYYDSENLHGCL